MTREWNQIKVPAKWQSNFWAHLKTIGLLQFKALVPNSDLSVFIIDIEIIGKKLTQVDIYLNSLLN